MNFLEPKKDINPWPTHCSRIFPGFSASLGCGTWAGTRAVVKKAEQGSQGRHLPWLSAASSLTEK